MFINFDIDTVIRWAIPIGIMIIGLVIGLLIEWVMIKAIVRMAKKTKWKWDDVIAESCNRAIAGLIFVFGIWIAAVYAPFESQAEIWIFRVLAGLATLIATIFLARLVAGFLTLGLERMGKALASASLITNTVKIIIIAIGIVSILHNFNIDIGPVFAALGIGGLAAALALQDTLSNFFAGFQIIATRQVRPNDYIRLETGELGRVIDVNWRNVTIQSHPDENLIVVPNSKIATTVMVNYNLPKRLLMEFITVGVSYDSDLDEVERIALVVAEQTVADVSGVTVTQKPQIRFREFSDFSILFQVRLFLPKLKGRGVYKSEFIKRLHKRFNEEGIVIPYPIRNVFLNNRNES